MESGFEDIEELFRETDRQMREVHKTLRDLEHARGGVAAQIEGRIEVALQEHLGILDALEDRDLGLAVRRLTAHLETVRELRLGSYR